MIKTAMFLTMQFFFDKFKEKNVKHLITLYDRNGVVIASRESTYDLPLLILALKKLLAQKY